ncbi:MAG TPA: CDP-alcohol phosphatidyltransferase family protein [Thermoplasmata archaeon]|nr:CDP-alcohol phosphatidyltransferase family protein [Thermoplasmata archaeon]
MATPFLGWTPGQLSGVAFGLSVAAGALAALVRWTTPLLFLAVAVLVFTSGVFDALDGEVARRTHRASRRGDFLDHVLDRYADVAIVLGIAASGYVDPIVALLALVGLLLVSYLGTQGQALGVGRIYAGLLGRADRMLVLTLAAFLEFDLSLPWPWAPTAPLSRIQYGGISFTVLDVAMVYFVVAGQLTAVLRARWLYRKLTAAGDAAPPAIP